MTTEKKRILVAEDSPGLARVVQFNMEHAGYDVTVARNGQEAWEQAQQHGFDIVLTDQQMPKMTGTQLCENLRTLPAYENTPVILLSAKGLEMDAAHLAATLGVVAVLPKPFSPMELVQLVEEKLAAIA